MKTDSAMDCKRALSISHNRPEILEAAAGGGGGFGLSVDVLIQESILRSSLSLQLIQ